MMISDSAAGNLAIRIGARGPNMSLATACASGTNALGEAAEMIRRGAADAMIAGASEAAIHPLTMAGMNVMTALSTRNDDPSAHPALRQGSRWLSDGRGRGDSYS